MVLLKNNVLENVVHVSGIDINTMIIISNKRLRERMKTLRYNTHTQVYNNTTTLVSFLAHAFWCTTTQDYMVYTVVQDIELDSGVDRGTALSFLSKVTRKVLKLFQISRIDRRLIVL